MTTDPFTGPDNDLDPDRSRPAIMSGYAGECGVCGLEFDEGDLIRATADGAGWEPVDHDHDPEESVPVVPTPTELGRVPLPPVPDGLYQDSPPDDRAPAQYSCPECPKSFAPTKDHLVRTHKALATGERCPGSRAVPTELLPTGTPEFGDAAPQPDTAPAAPAAPVLVPEAGSALAAAVAGSSQVAAAVDRINAGRAGMFTPSESARDLLAGDDRSDPIDTGAQPVPWTAAARYATGEESGAVNDVVAEAERLLGGDDGRTPEQQAEMDARREAGAAAEVARLAARLSAAPPEDATVHAHDDYDKRLEQAFSAAGVDGRSAFSGGLLPAVPEPVHTITTMAPGTVSRVAEESYRPAEPEPDRDSYGRYLLPDPVTGKGRSWRRATTFAGVLDDTWNLDLWQKRHLVRGAAMAAVQDPGRLTPAARLDVREDKRILNDLVDALMADSGVNTAAEQGTYVHTLTEDIDRSADADQRNAAWAQVPDHYRADITAYGRALDQAGFRVVPSMLERRTAVVEFGVAGTFDQLLQLTRDIPGVGRAGDYVVGDKKTGSDMSYGQGTHSIQLALYAHGLNSVGVWDGHTNQWVRSVPVREDVGIIIHIPLQGGDCTLHVLDLTVGWAAAQLAHRVYNFRSVAKAKGRNAISRVLHTVHVEPYRAPEAPAVQQIVQAPASELTPQQIEHWAGRGRSVRSKADASVVFTEMVAAGLTEAQRGKMVAFMNQVLDGAVANAGPHAPAYTPVSPEEDPGSWESRVLAVTTKQQASALFQEMVSAGLPEEFRNSAVKQMVSRLEAADAAAGPAPSVPSGIDVLSAEYWTPQAMGVTTKQEASGIFGAMTAAGVHDDVKAQMVQRMTDWLASQAQAAALMDAVTAPGAPAPAADSVVWEVKADRVLTREQASALYRQAQTAPGMTAERLSGLVERMNASMSNEPPF